MGQKPELTQDSRSQNSPPTVTPSWKAVWHQRFPSWVHPPEPPSGPPQRHGTRELRAAVSPDYLPPETTHHPSTAEWQAWKTLRSHQTEGGPALPNTRGSPSCPRLADPEKPGTKAHLLRDSIYIRNKIKPKSPIVSGVMGSPLEREGEGQRGLLTGLFRGR